MRRATRMGRWTWGALMLWAMSALPLGILISAAEAQVSLGWAGQEEDLTGAGQVKPDGGKDGHFRLALTLPSQTEIRSVALYSASAEGTPAGGQVWHSASGSYWVAGVFHNGSRLHDAQVPALGRFSGETVFDVYCSDSGWFKPKNYFLVEVELGTGQKLRAVTQITGQPVAVLPPSGGTGSAPPGAVEVAVLAYGKDESDGSEVGWDTLYPHPSFDDDPNRRGLPNAKWIGTHWWQGNTLCLSIKNLEAPWPPAHRLAIGYSVTLGGGRFADGTQTKTFVLYRYSGVPQQKEIMECHPVAAWTR